MVLSGGFIRWFYQVVLIYVFTVMVLTSGFIKWYISGFNSLPVIQNPTHKSMTIIYHIAVINEYNVK